MKKFKTMFKNNLDERELGIRSNIYLKSYSILTVLLLGIIFAKEYFQLDLFYGDWEYLIALFISITYCIIMTICKEIYPLKKFRIGFIILGLYSFIFFIIYLKQILDNNALIIDNQLSLFTCRLIFISFYLLTTIAYIIKIIYNRYHDEEEI